MQERGRSIGSGNVISRSAETFASGTVVDSTSGALVSPPAAQQHHIVGCTFELWLHIVCRLYIPCAVGTVSDWQYALAMLQ